MDQFLLGMERGIETRMECGNFHSIPASILSSITRFIPSFKGSHPNFFVLCTMAQTKAYFSFVSTHFSWEWELKILQRKMH